jgi:N-acetyl-anhydromuramyl-L-alanine amidase AmpD
MRRAGRRVNPVSGLAIHTAGGNATAKALKVGRDPLSFLVDLYGGDAPDGKDVVADFDYFPHYVIGWGGRTVPVCPEEDRALHIGVSKAEWSLLSTQGWRSHPPSGSDGQQGPSQADWAAFVGRWTDRWSGFDNPAALTNGHLPNDVLIGVELCAGAKLQFGPEKLAGSYTNDQYLALAKLYGDIAGRRGWTGHEALYPHPSHSVRILCHEDCNPLTRANRPSGGWDPGCMREQPSFDWELLRSHVQRIMGLVDDKV